MSLNQGMTAAARELSAAARVTFATGAAVELDGGDVLAFSVEEGADSALLPGAVLSARMTLDLNDEDVPQVRIQLYRYDGASCLAVLDGEPAALVAREDVVDLMEAVRTLLLG